MLTGRAGVVLAILDLDTALYWKPSQQQFGDPCRLHLLAGVIDPAGQAATLHWLSESEPRLVDFTLPPDVFYVSLALSLRGDGAQVPAGKARLHRST